MSVKAERGPHRSVVLSQICFSLGATVIGLAVGLSGVQEAQVSTIRSNHDRTREQRCVNGPRPTNANDRCRWPSDGMGRHEHDDRALGFAFCRRQFLQPALDERLPVVAWVQSFFVEPDPAPTIPQVVPQPLGQRRMLVMAVADEERSREERFLGDELVLAVVAQASVRVGDRHDSRRPAFWTGDWSFIWGCSW